MISNSGVRSVPRGRGWCNGTTSNVGVSCSFPSVNSFCHFRGLSRPRVERRGSRRVTGLAFSSSAREILTRFAYHWVLQDARTYCAVRRCLVTRARSRAFILPVFPHRVRRVVFYPFALDTVVRLRMTIRRYSFVVFRLACPRTTVAPVSVVLKAGRFVRSHILSIARRSFVVDSLFCLSHRDRSVRRNVSAHGF